LYIFSSGNFGENSAENFPHKNVGENWNFLQKKFQKSCFQEIPHIFLRKIAFRKNVQKKWPLVVEGLKICAMIPVENNIGQNFTHKIQPYYL
jgi:hypothetical protein